MIHDVCLKRNNLNLACARSDFPVRTALPMILAVQAIIREANISKGYAGWRQYRVSRTSPMK
ncbi:hypothetical protein [Asaia bogorensis]|uniref:hypothetical protein n=1 Tax=Asaia bogorensis TaxID=91915 RepID=UPI00285B76E7|nr:hypothetical protein [Asaia bogorensis]MDR6183304.1 hypothetical protein [Asaia bogorensis NBRC 16594]